MKNFIIFFIIAFVLILVFMKKKLNVLSEKNFTPKDAFDALLKIKEKKGTDRAKLLEKILRYETRHFESKQYKLTGSAGMEVGKWSKIPAGSTQGFIEMDDIHKSGMEKFIVWNSVFDFLMYLSDYIDRHNGNYARWNSLDLFAQSKYRKGVESVTAKIV